MNCKLKGGQGENAAAGFLADLEYTILERNYRCRRGEIDIIAVSARTLVFVEVKSWDVYDVDALEYSINTAKMKRIIATSRHFIVSRPEYDDYRIRYDIILVKHGTLVAKHITGAFTEN